MFDLHIRGQCPYKSDIMKIDQKFYTNEFLYSRLTPGELDTQQNLN